MESQIINKKYPLTMDRSISYLELGSNNTSSQSNDLKTSKSTSSYHHYNFYSYTKSLFHLIFSLQILLSFILNGSEGKVLELSDRYISLFA